MFEAEAPVRGRFTPPLQSVGQSHPFQLKSVSDTCRRFSDSFIGENRTLSGEATVASSQYARMNRETRLVFIGPGGETSS